MADTPDGVAEPGAPAPAQGADPEAEPAHREAEPAHREVEPTPTTGSAWTGLLAVGLWAAALAAVRAAALAITEREGHEELRLGAAPLVGREDTSVDLRLLLPLVVGGVLVVVLPRLAARLRWRHLLLVVVLASVAWVAAVNLTRPEGLTRPLERDDEYLVDVAEVGSPGAFLESYPDRIDEYSVHVRSHPPGFLLLLWGMDEVGLGGAAWAAVLVVGAGAAGLASVLVGVREAAGERAARRAAPFLVLAPAALWIGSTADALYAGVGATGVALLLVASGRDSPGRWPGAGPALAGGLVLGLCLTFSYGLWLLGFVALPTLLWRRRWDLLPVAAAGALVVVGAFWLAGFDYLAAFDATRVEVEESVQSTRPFRLFLVLNLVVLGLAVGPAVVAGIARLRDGATWLLVGGALLAVAAADLSGLSKGEVERIWLPFTVWLLAAGSAHRAPARGWLAAQVAVAVAVQALARTGW